MQAIGHLGDYFAHQKEARSNKKAKRDAEAAKSMDNIIREQIRGSSWESVQQKLAENDINSFDALINLSDDDINSLGLSLGHKGLLRGYIRSMREAQLFRSCLFQLNQLPASFIAQLTGTPTSWRGGRDVVCCVCFCQQKVCVPPVQSDGGGWWVVSG